MKKYISVLLGIMMLLCGVIPCRALHYCTEHITDPEDLRVEAALTAILKQSFTKKKAESVKKYIEHFCFDSRYSAFDGEIFPWQNGGERAYTIDDGTYEVDEILATGCYAYAKFVTSVIYGRSGTWTPFPDECYKPEGLRNFAAKYFQAGEHLRIEGRHSVVFVSATKDGFYFIDYSSDYDGHIQFCYVTYEDYCDYACECGYDLSYYENDKAKNDAEKVLSGTVLYKNFNCEEMTVSFGTLSEALDYANKNGGVMTELGLASLPAGFLPENSYTVSVPLKYIAADISEAKIVYNIGEEYTSDGLRVFAVYGNNIESKLLKNTDFTIGGFDSSAEGSCIITIAYGEKNTEYFVTVVPQYTGLLGDINGDGEIKAADARLVLRFSAGLETLTDEQKYYADYDQNGSVKASDARLILRRSAGL